MNVEDRITTGLRETLDHLDVPRSAPTAALARGSSMRRRRTATRLAAVAAAVAVVAAIGTVVAAGDGDQPDPARGGGWSGIPSPPLSARSGSVAVWAGGKAIFIGGQSHGFCPPGADCAAPDGYRRDGAAYDPQTETWTPVADAPFDVAPYLPRVVVGGQVVMADEAGWYSYDVEADSWGRLPAPPTSVELNSASLSANGGDVYVLGERGDVYVLDMTEETWSTLPPSPHLPELEQTSLTATPEGVALIGVDATQRNDGTEPSYLIADVYRDGAWHRSERSDMTGGYGWHWTGERLVSPTPTCVDGGEVNPFPRCIPEGGTFDPETGTWDDLPAAPSDPSHGWSLVAEGGPWMLSYGLLYDDATRSWTNVGAPDGYGELMDSASVVAEGAVIAFGGVEWLNGGVDVVPTDKAWVWRP